MSERLLACPTCGSPLDSKPADHETLYHYGLSEPYMTLLEDGKATYFICHSCSNNRKVPCGYIVFNDGVTFAWTRREKWIRHKRLPCAMMMFFTTTHV